MSNAPHFAGFLRIHLQFLNLLFNLNRDLESLLHHEELLQVWGQWDLIVFFLHNASLSETSSQLSICLRNLKPNVESAHGTPGCLHSKGGSTSHVLGTISKSELDARGSRVTTFVASSKICSLTSVSHTALAGDVDSVRNSSHPQGGL